MDAPLPSPRRLTPSATLAINERSAALQAQGREIYRFGLGQSPFPVPASVVAALRRNAHQKDYLPVAGLPALRAAVAAWHQRHDGLQARAEDVLIGPGSKELMFLLQLVLDCELVVPAPCWVSYVPQAQVLGRPVACLPTRFADRWQLQAATLDAHCRADPGRPRLLILNSPGNPDGDTYGPAALSALADVARRHGVLVLSDEIYGPLHFGGAAPSFGRWYPEGTITSGGLSKWCGAGGWRLGTALFSPALASIRDAVAAAASETFTSVAAPIQHAAVTAFQGGAELEHYLVQSRRVLAGLAHGAALRLGSAGARVHTPTAAFYLWADLGPHAQALARRGIVDSAGLAEGLLDQAGVAVLPGSAFQMAPERLCIRLATVDFDGTAALAIAEGSAPDAAIPPPDLQAAVGRVWAGIDALTAWVQG